MEYFLYDEISACGIFVISEIYINEKHWCLHELEIKQWYSHHYKHPYSIVLQGLISIGTIVLQSLISIGSIIDFQSVISIIIIIDLQSVWYQ